MPYTTPIYDRTILDVAGRTTKGLFNLVDFNRVYSNSVEVHTLLLSKFGPPPMLTVIPAMSVHTIPTAGNISTLVGNIELMRVWIEASYPSMLSDPTLKASWAAGEAPDYADVNDWERTTDNMYTALNAAVVTMKPRTGVAAAGQSAVRLNRWRG